MPPDEPDDLDGCEVDFTVEDQLTEDGDQTLALVLFADCWDDPDKVIERRAELTVWDAALQREDG